MLVPQGGRTHPFRGDDHVSSFTLLHCGDAHRRVGVRIDRAQGYDTTITWKGNPGGRYTVYWRETSSPVWQGSVRLGSVETYTAKKLSKDDYIFAIGAVGGIPVEAR